MRWFVTVLVVIASVVIAPAASAARPRCVRTVLWTNQDGDTWKFERCIDGVVYANRWGGPLGSCHLAYPDGQRYMEPKDDCGYYVNGGPI